MTSAGQVSAVVALLKRTLLADVSVAAGLAVFVAALAMLPEWRHPGFYYHDDMQLQYVPGIVEIGRACRSGHLATLSAFSWFGGALAGEYQHGVFSLFHVLLCACIVGSALPKVASVVSVTYFALAAAGAYLAARAIELSRSLAISVALVAALNGFNVTWGSWLPAIVGWAWLMWVWYAMERLCRAARWNWGDTGLVAFSAYSVLASGWHFTDLLLPALLVCVLWRHWQRQRGKLLLVRTGVALGLGLCLALPPVLCFLEYARVAARSDFDQRSWAWTVPWQALKGLILPLSTAPWLAFYRQATLTNIAMAGGGVPLLVVVGAIFVPAGVRRRAVAPLLVAAGATLAWTMLPSVSRVRWPFRWLPVFHLLVVLAAARVLALERQLGVEPLAPSARIRPRVRRQLLVAASGAALIACALAAADFDADAAVCAAVALMGVMGLLLAAFMGWDATKPFCVAVTLNLLMAPLGTSERLATPTWSSLERCTEEWAKVDRRARYLSLYIAPDIIDPVDASVGRAACVMPGNAAMVAGLTFVNGYSTLFVAGLRRTLGLEVHGDLNVKGIVATIGPLAKPGGLLERWGIDRLVLPAEPYLHSLVRRVTDAGFRPAQALHGAWIWRREVAAPPRPLLESLSAAVVRDSLSSDALLTSDPTLWHYVRSPDLSAVRVDPHAPPVRFAPILLADEVVQPDRVEASVAVSATPALASGLLLLRRPYLPGYRARLDGATLELGRLDDTLVGVVIPSGRSGRLKIEYVPLGLRLPALLGALLALLILASGLGYELFRRLRKNFSAGR
jgi:hypothetical protein